MAQNLAFLPGTMCDYRVWAPVRALLEPHFSTSYMATETRPTRAGMLELIDSAARAARPLHLVAFSMGGYLALEYALNHPGRVASLVTVASSAFGLTEREAAERARALELLEKHEYRGISPARINQFVHPSRQSDSAIVGLIRAMDGDLGKTVLVNQLRETSTRASLASRLGGACDSHTVHRRGRRPVRAVGLDRADDGADTARAAGESRWRRPHDPTGAAGLARPPHRGVSRVSLTSGRVDRSVRREDGEHRFGCLRLAQRRADAFLTENTGCARQSTQVIGARICRREQHEDQVGGTFVDRLEISRLQQPRKASHGTRQSFNAGMRNSDAFADPGGPQTFPFQHGFVHETGIEPQGSGHQGRHFGQDLFLALPSRPRRNGARKDEVAKARRDVIA